MNVTNLRPTEDVPRNIAPVAGLAGATAPTDRVTMEAYQSARPAIEAGRRVASGKRAANVAKLEADVRGGSYVPDSARIAAEILADTEAGIKLRSILQH